MSECSMMNYLATSFDEAVEHLTQLRNKAQPKPARIEFAFPVDVLPEGLMAEFCREAQRIGLEVKLAA